MAGVDSGTGVAGSSFTHYAYPGIYQDQVCDDNAAKMNASISFAFELDRTFIIVDCSLEIPLRTTLIASKSKPANC